MSVAAINLSLYALPVAYCLGILPATYCLLKMMSATGGKWSNVSPRTNFELHKETVPKEILDRCIRANGAHLNAMEGFPLFAAAMIAGNITNLPAHFLNKIAITYLLLRTLYTGLYIVVKNETLSLARTVVWWCSIGLGFWTLIKAGNNL